MLLVLSIGLQRNVFMSGWSEQSPDSVPSSRSFSALEDTPQPNIVKIGKSSLIYGLLHILTNDDTFAKIM